MFTVNVVSLEKPHELHIDVMNIKTVIQGLAAAATRAHLWEMV